MSRKIRSGWILGPRADVLIFTGPVALAGLIIAALAAGPGLQTPMAPWAFALLIVGCDVAHVYATAFRVYLDPAALRRRPGLYLGIPLVCLAAGVPLYAHSALIFWRVLAYVAVFHFVRQQWGWVALSRRAAGERDLCERRLDQLAIYNATLFPLLFWHAHLPRLFVWFVPGDFAAGLSAQVSDVAFWLHWAINIFYVYHQLQRLLRGRGVNWAKLHIWLTTWMAWYGGMVVFNSDWAFTTLNVLAHGVPYLVVVRRVETLRHQNGTGLLARVFRPGSWALFLGPLLLAGFLEEWLWDRAVWHDHAMLFPGAEIHLGQAALTLLVPLLCLPQATHYVLDGWIWKLRSNPEVQALVSSERP